MIPLKNLNFKTPSTYTMINFNQNNNNYYVLHFKSTSLIHKSDKPKHLSTTYKPISLLLTL